MFENNQIDIDQACIRIRLFDNGESNMFALMIIN